MLSQSATATSAKRGTAAASPTRQPGRAVEAGSEAESGRGEDEQGVSRRDQIAQQPHTGEQCRADEQGALTDAVDVDARRELHHSVGQPEDRHGETGAGVGDAELRADGREHRGDDESHPQNEEPSGRDGREQSARTAVSEGADSTGDALGRAHSVRRS